MFGNWGAGLIDGSVVEGIGCRVHCVECRFQYLRSRVYGSGSEV